MFIFPCYFFTNYKTQFSYLYNICFLNDNKTILTIHKWPFTQKAAKEFEIFLFKRVVFFLNHNLRYLNILKTDV